MARKRNRRKLLENIEIEEFGSDGKALGKYNDKVVFVPFAAPGDIVDVQTRKQRRHYMEGDMARVIRWSPLRTKPVCKHFGVCGGCKWQHIPYDLQLKFKEKQVADQLTRIGKVEFPPVCPILASEKTTGYRNKLEYSFSSMKWLTDYSKETDFSTLNMNGLGFHLPGMFHRILDINTCYLQEDLTNSIRNLVKKTALEKGYSFYHAKTQKGLLRNLIVRNNMAGQWMVVLVIKEFNEKAIEDILGTVGDAFSQVVSLMYIINHKPNDSVEGLDANLYGGQDYLMETLGALRFKTGPLSFFQTNPHQAQKMYECILSLSQLTGNETVYDLYTGTGSIALFVAEKAKKVTGIEYVPQAIEDAEKNMLLNGITNTSFHSGDMAKVLTPSFVEAHGKPQVVITDPPRAGMHKDVVKQLVNINPERIIYVSCNPATQARDLQLMKEQYHIWKVQPLDMFPHTHHVENIVVLNSRK